MFERPLGTITSKMEVFFTNPGLDSDPDFQPRGQNYINKIYLVCDFTKQRKNFLPAQSNLGFLHNLICISYTYLVPINLGYIGNRQEGAVTDNLILILNA